MLTRSALDGPADRRAGEPATEAWPIDRRAAGLLAEARPIVRRPGRFLADLVLAEARLIRLAVPIASALVLALGVAVVLAQGGAELVLSLVAPIVAAAGVAGTYRSRREPAAELVAATPASGRMLLLVRIALVFGYDLVLALAASAVLSAAGATGADGLDALVGVWLGPMALLSSLGLLVAVWLGPDIALGAAVGVWAVRVLAGGMLAGGALARDAWPARLVVAVWSTNAPVLAASAALAAAAVLVAGRAGSFLGEPRNG